MGWVIDFLYYLLHNLVFEGLHMMTGCLVLQFKSFEQFGLVGDGIR